MLDKQQLIMDMTEIFRNCDGNVVSAEAALKELTEGAGFWGK